MQKTDLDLLAKQLNALTEVFDKKPVTPKALEVWFDALREFPTERVMTVLIGWSKTHGKFPTPADVWKSTNDMCIDLREAKAREEKATIERETRFMGVTTQGEEIILRIREILHRPRLTPKQHWERILNNPKAIPLAKEYAMAALSKKEREPGEDDERIAA